MKDTTHAIYFYYSLILEIDFKKQTDFLMAFLSTLQSPIELP